MRRAEGPGPEDCLKEYSQFVEILMKLIDVLGKEKWGTLLEEFSQKYGLVVSLLDINAALVLKRGDQNVMCSHIREKKDNRTFICAQTARGMTAELMETKKPVLDFCEAGMTRFAIPVIQNSILLGQVTGCGVITDREEIDLFMLFTRPGILARR